MGQTLIDIYTDGSFRKGVTTWGMVAVANEENIFEAYGVLSGPIAQMHQVGGELKAVVTAVKYCKEQGLQANIYHDYTGIYGWVADCFGGAGKPWKRNNEWTQGYAAYMKRNRMYVADFRKVKAHSGNKWNDYADALCEKALKEYLTETLAATEELVAGA